MFRVRCLACCALLQLFGCGVLGTDEVDQHRGAIAAGEGPARVPSTEPVGLAGSGAAPAEPLPAAPEPEPGTDAMDGDVEPIPDPSDSDPAAQLSTSVASEPSDAPQTGPCRAVAPELLRVAGAGEGAFSGCAPRTCTGIDIAPLWEAGTLGYELSDLAGFEGCTVIEGDLQVAMHPGTDLSVLHCLERVTGSVVIWNNPALLSLAGLESLAEVGGSFELGMHASLSIGNDALADFDALVSLRTIGDRFGVAGGIGLQRFGALPKLEIVGGEVFFQFFHGAEELAGLNALTIVGGAFNLWRPEGLQRVTGLQALDTIGGMFVLWGATDLVELAGMPSLACIGGNVDIGGDESWENNPVLRDVRAFPALRTVGDTLLLQWNPALETFDMLGAAERVRSMFVLSNPKLRSLPLDTLTSTEELDVRDNPLLDECPLKQAASRALTEIGAGYFENNLACP